MDKWGLLYVQALFPNWNLLAYENEMATLWKWFSQYWEFLDNSKNASLLVCYPLRLILSMDMIKQRKFMSYAFIYELTRTQLSVVPSIFNSGLGSQRVLPWERRSQEPREGTGPPPSSPWSHRTKAGPLWAGSLSKGSDQLLFPLMEAYFSVLILNKIWRNNLHLGKEIFIDF